MPVYGRGLVPPQLPPTVHRTIMFVDVADFTNPGRDVADLLAVQQGVYDVLRTAFNEAGIDYDSCHTEDRGDGALVLIPADVPKSLLAQYLPDCLVSALWRHNATAAASSQFKLRIGIHAGDIRRNTHGWVGQAVNIAARILEADQVKAALARSDGVLAFVASDYFYSEVIAPDPGVGPDRYRPIDVSVKTFSATIWLRIAGEIETAPVPIPEPVAVSESEAVVGIVPTEELDTLRDLLLEVEVPNLPLLVARAVGPAIAPPPPGSAWDVFEYLSDCNAGPDGVPPALVYLKLLAREVGGTVEVAVSAWVDQQTRRLRLSAVVAELQAGWEPIVEESPLHLMIAVEPDAIDPRRCVLSFWRQDDPSRWPPTRGDVREVDVRDLEHRVDEIILATERVWADQSAAAVVEFVLARSMLTLPVYRWCKELQSGEPRPLIFDYRLVVRSLERMRTTYWHRPWKKRWHSVTDHPSIDRVHPFGGDNPGGPIDAVLTDPRWFGLVMDEPPTPQPLPDAGPDPLTAALRAGLPLICWHPTAGSEDLRKPVDWLLGGEGGFVDVPSRRQVALRSAANDYDLVYDLVVMWEDPYRVITFDGPSIPTPQ